MEETRTVRQSALANYLLKRCVLGFMSPQEAQQIAAAAQADVATAVDYVTGESDGFSFEGINRLAAIGGIWAQQPACLDCFAEIDEGHPHAESILLSTTSSLLR